MTDLTWDEFQEDKKKAEQQVNLILNEFGKKYKVTSMGVSNREIMSYGINSLQYCFSLEVKI